MKYAKTAFLLGVLTLMPLATSCARTHFNTRGYEVGLTDGTNFEQIDGSSFSVPRNWTSEKQIRFGHTHPKFPDLDPVTEIQFAPDTVLLMVLSEDGSELTYMLGPVRTSLDYALTVFGPDFPMPLLELRTPRGGGVTFTPDRERVNGYAVYRDRRRARYNSFKAVQVNYDPGRSLNSERWALYIPPSVDGGERTIALGKRGDNWEMHIR